MLLTKDRVFASIFVSIFVVVGLAIVWIVNMPADPKKQYEVALKYDDDKGIDSKTIALFLLDRSADKGYFDAQYALAEYYFGDHKSGDYAKSLPWLKKVYQQGGKYLIYANAIGYIYDHGLGEVYEDNEKAEYWYNEAINRANSMPAMINLAALYINGDLGDQDLEAAEKLLLKAVKTEGGDRAMPELAYLYHEKGDLDNTILWLRKGLESNNSEIIELTNNLVSQFNITMD